MNTQQLKAKLLDLLIKGELTSKWRESHKDIDSAEVLLERIIAEKEKKLNDEPISKGKKPNVKVKIKEVSDNDKPFEIPASWKWCHDGKWSMLSYDLLTDLIKKLAHENPYFKPELLWNYYEWLKNGESPEDLTKFKEGRTVIPLEEKNDIDDAAKIKAVTNIIQLVRFALKSTEKLQSYCVGYNQRFNLWLGHEQQKNYHFNDEQKKFLRIVAERICLNGAIDVEWLRNQEDFETIATLKSIYGSFDAADTEIEVLNKFILEVA